MTGGFHSPKIPPKIHSNSQFSHKLLGKPVKVIRQEKPVNNNKPQLRIRMSHYTEEHITSIYDGTQTSHSDKAQFTEWQ